MRFHDSFHNEKTQARALACGTRYLPKAIKDSCQLVFRNSRSGVFNRKLNAIFELGGSYGNRSVGWGKLDCIANEVCKHLHRSLAVYKDWREVFRSFGREVDIFPRCQGLHHFQCLHNQWTNSVYLPLNRHMLGFDTRC